MNPTSLDIEFPAYQDAWAAGFNAITGCGFGPGGFYVTEFSVGDVIRIAVKPGGTAGATTAVVSGLHQPNGFVAGPDGSIYVSDFSVSSGGGRVVRVNN